MKLEFLFSHNGKDTGVLQDVALDPLLFNHYDLLLSKTSLLLLRSAFVF